MGLEKWVWCYNYVKMGAGICGVRWRKGFLPLGGVRILCRPAGLSPSVYAWGAGASVSAGPDAKRGDF